MAQQCVAALTAVHATRGATMQQPARLEATNACDVGELGSEGCSIAVSAEHTAV